MFCIFALYMCFTCHAETVSQRGNNTNTISSARNKQTVETKRKTDTVSRSVETTKKNISSARTAVKEKVGVTQRANSQSIQKQKNITPRSATRTSTTKVTARTATNNNITNRKQLLTRTNKTKISRAGEINTNAIEQIKSKDLTKCKTVYYDCMDEFCANKDSSLRRCACSSKVHDFDKAKKKLEQFEDKMLDFNKQLLTVSMDKEDAAVINIATEGELAANTKDTSESQKILNKITDALNSNGKNKFNTNLSSISLSLNEDTVWDNIDLNSGVSTTTKEGVDLYNSVLPMCEEMTLEICSQDDLEIIKSNYLLSIEQDCNTVAKSYESKYNQAKDKVYESSSLLDMSRLTVYQDKNSDDILTCRKKMIEQLSDVNVCGKDLYKCLDISGNYINPATGEAVLTENLYNLTNLIKEPSANETWQNINKGSQFIRFLTSKKTFLESAMSTCEDVKDIIWDDFINDALAKIKLAQNSKLDEIRQSCTTLLSECSAKSMTDLTEFDPRAISTFAVSATLTTQAMCSNISNSCSALMNYLDTNNSTNPTSIAEADWTEGIHGVQTNIALDSIYQNCLLVGQACVVDNCSGIAGDFTQCTRTATDSTEQRDIILSRLNCWQEVKDCVAQAEIMIEKNIVPTIKLADEQYPTSIDYILGIKFLKQYPEPGSVAICNTECTTDSFNSVQCAECLIAETIWGNCYLGKIQNQDNKTTILSWFGDNTGSSDCSTSTVINTEYFCHKQQKEESAYNYPLYWKQMSGSIDDFFVDTLKQKCSIEDHTKGTLKACTYTKIQISNDDTVKPIVDSIDKCTTTKPSSNGNALYIYPFLSCPAGQKYEIEQTHTTHQCKQCDAGTYQDKSGQTSCSKCKKGYYQDTPGQENCKQCNAGTYQNKSGQTSCTSCSIGNYCEAGSTEQTPCKKGYYCANPTKQQQCTLGNYCPEGSSKQTPCDKGHFCPDGIEAQDCKPGTYQDETGQQSCKQCPQNSVCTGTGLTSFSCETGYHKDGGKCEANTYIIVFNRNTANTAAPSDQTCKYGQDCKLPQIISMEKTDHIFKAWNTKKDDSGISYKDGATVFNLSKEHNDRITLYAQWCRVCQPNAANALCELNTTNQKCEYITSCKEGYGNLQNEGKYNPSCSKISQ